MDGIEGNKNAVSQQQALYGVCFFDLVGGCLVAAAGFFVVGDEVGHGYGAVFLYGLTKQSV